MLQNYNEYIAMLVAHRGQVFVSGKPYGVEEALRDSSVKAAVERLAARGLIEIHYSRETASRTIGDFDSTIDASEITEQYAKAHPNETRDVKLP